MGYTITHDEINVRYIVSNSKDTILIIKPYEKGGSWIGIEYEEEHDQTLEDFDLDKCKTVNEVIDEVDAAILFKTKDLPTMLRELASLMEGK